MKASYYKLKLSFQAKKAIKELDERIPYLSNHLSSTFNDEAEYKSLVTLNLYCYMYQRDLCIALRAAVSATKNEEHFHLRSLALLIFEYIEKIQHILGSEFMTLLTKHSPNENVLLAYKKINKQLGIIRNENSKYLKRIRDKCTAHRSFDPNLQLNILDNLDSNRITQLWVEVSSFQTMIFDMCSLVISKKFMSGLEKT